MPKQMNQVQKHIKVIKENDVPKLNLSQLKEDLIKSDILIGEQH